jgi:hypothetical protein
MGLLKALSNVFTPRQFKKPSEWLSAIPLIQDEIRITVVLVDDSLSDWVTILRRIYLEKANLQGLYSVEDESPYPIRMSDRLFGQLEKLLFCQPLTEAELAQVRAGGPQIAPPGDEAGWRTQPCDIQVNHNGTLLILPSE